MKAVDFDSIILQRLEEKHFDEIIKIGNHESISRTSEVELPLTYNQVLSWRVSKNGDRETFVIQWHDIIVGLVSLKKVNYTLAEAEVSYWLGVDYWKKGIMKIALSKILFYAFDSLKLSVINAHALRNNNVASIALLGRFGFIPDSNMLPLAVTGRFQLLFPNDWWDFYKVTKHDYYEKIKLQADY